MLSCIYALQALQYKEGKRLLTLLQPFLEERLSAFDHRLAADYFQVLCLPSLQLQIGCCLIGLLDSCLLATEKKGY